MRPIVYGIQAHAETVEAEVVTDGSYYWVTLHLRSRHAPPFRIDILPDSTVPPNVAYLERLAEAINWALLKPYDAAHGPDCRCDSCRINDEARP